MGFKQKSPSTAVTNARAAAVAAGAQGPAQQAQAENALTGTLRSLLRIVENYVQAEGQPERPRAPGAAGYDREPDLDRQHYNATVLDYNTTIATIPSNFIASPFGFKAQEFFDKAEAAQTPSSI